MKKILLKPILASSIVALMLSGCVQGGMPTIKNADGTSNRAGTGALLGGLLGAVVGGSTVNHSGKRVAIGGALGAAVGAAIGYSLDQQAQEVAQTLNTNVNNNPTAEQNSNNQLVVSNTDKFVKIMFRDPMMFRTNESIPTPSAEAEIRQMIPALQKPAYANMIIQTVGHTDSRGSFQHNQALSEARASSVGNTLQSGGVTNEMFSKGCSYSKPVVPNTSPANMALNRRVEIYLYPNQEAVIDPCVK
ncbi:Outer membrane lipoprotein omp16 precursor [hydrothermal vent metagenome]|uniref:Outer membrane lipoprotein omp16 n=1 Tax=hydrothermal vent metagenome TaxID=652676 RepID=A0A1W1CPH5_9ZZZZ